jgi:hypothetical protein
LICIARNCWLIGSLPKREPSLSVLIRSSKGD